jgi:organic radical activating enzyme
MSSLLIAEMFYSQQSEGISTGFPAFFIRLSKCNLLCGGVDGSLVKKGKAEWFCDTIKVWKKGKQYNFDEIIDNIKKSCNWDWVKEGRIHIIFSGGEPTLPEHQTSIIEFTNYLKFNYPNADFYFELETNGTILFNPDFYNCISQINCSPKLENSGMSRNKRINLLSLQQITTHSNYQFKFVITKEKDIDEIHKDFINLLGIPWQNIVLMPGVDNRDSLPEITRIVFELGKKYGYRSITRSHILAWNRLTGV